MSLAGWLMVATFAAPLLLAAALAHRWLRPVALALAPWAAGPAFTLGIGLHGSATLDWSWALLGTQLGPVTDETTRTFLLFTGGLWLAAGLFARASQAEDPHRARFWAFFLLTLSGNVGVVLAQDVASFYGFFALMTFASYGLIVHEQGAEALRAGRLYVVMALVGELLLLAAFVFIAGEDLNLALQRAPLAVANSRWPGLLSTLLLVGFGIKAGAFLLHMWLPLAHPVAPTPASAVLSGALIKAGLLGWLRFLPLGLVPLPTQGLACLSLGLVGAYFGVAAGLAQRDPKAVLAYSSVSQMGLVTAALGVGLWNPGAAPLVTPALLLFAAHHALAKGALFLGTGVLKAAGSGPGPKRVLVGLLLLPALVLTGAPFTSGALAKHALSELLEHAPFAGVLSWVLSFTAVGTTLLMFHLLVIAAAGRTEHRRGPPLSLLAPWVVLIAVSVGLPFFLVGAAPHGSWAASWPVLLGALLGAASWLLRRGRPLRPAENLLLLLERALARLRPLIAAPAAEQGGPHLPARLWGRVLRASAQAEVGLARFGTIGLLFVILVLLVLAVQRGEHRLLP